MSIRMGCM